MSSRSKALLDPTKKQDLLLNGVCVVFAVGFIALAFINAVKAGDFLTIDSLFLTMVALLLAGVFMISPLYFLYSNGMINNPFVVEDDTSVAVHADHAEGTTRLFVSVWVWLLAMTGIEVFLGYIQLPIHIMLTVLIGLSLVKAALIIAYFMHLRFERLSLVLTLIPMLVVCICLFFIFFPDGMRTKNLRTNQVQTTAPAAEK